MEKEMLLKYTKDEIKDWKQIFKRESLSPEQEEQEFEDDEVVFEMMDEEEWKKLVNLYCDAPTYRQGEIWEEKGIWAFTVLDMTVYTPEEEDVRRIAYPKTFHPKVFYKITYRYKNSGYRSLVTEGEEFIIDLAVNMFSDAAGKEGRVFFPRSGLKDPCVICRGETCTAECIVAVENAGPVKFYLEQEKGDIDNVHEIKTAVFTIAP